MTNVEIKVEGSIMTIKVDLSKDFGACKSEGSKNNIVAATHGYQPVAEGIKMNMNVIRRVR